jgi:hypothetical protein
MSAPLNTTYLQMFIYTKMYWVKAYILTWHTTGSNSIVGKSVKNNPPNPHWILQIEELEDIKGVIRIRTY